ncbi:hypothetical protein OIE67_27170 [Nonomuraea fuscirosea]|uniref:hypothetical protein n=1 Tax=Nonomuraea fuscirosea TaxID=1291556 RepID=UPI002DDA438C|nr:hypothetical protein [Nonomuraea fuscirosea]WSA58175.1 hypothetical protein OIE67_27170 [Nonomuraea fuscirosea]
MLTESAQQRARGILFHAMIADPRGDHLLPLAMLRERYPDLHARHIAKYVGREHLLDERVGPLACTWAEVVFLSPVNPTVLFDAIRSGGRRMGDVPLWTLDASQLDPARCCIRLMRVTSGARTADPGTDDDYLPLTSATLRAVSEVTDRALERLRNLGPDEPLLPWGDVPHVLHRGPVPLNLFQELLPPPTRH